MSSNYTHNLSKDLHLQTDKSIKNLSKEINSNISNKNTVYVHSHDNSNNSNAFKLLTYNQNTQVNNTINTNNTMNLSNSNSSFVKRSQTNIPSINKLNNSKFKQRNTIDKDIKGSLFSLMDNSKSKLNDQIRLTENNTLITNNLYPISEINAIKNVSTNRSINANNNGFNISTKTSKNNLPTFTKNVTHVNNNRINFEDIPKIAITEEDEDNNKFNSLINYNPLVNNSIHIKNKKKEIDINNPLYFKINPYIKTKLDELDELYAEKLISPKSKGVFSPAAENIISKKDQEIQHLIAENHGLTKENVLLKSNISILEGEIIKLNNVLNTVVNSQFTKIDQTRLLNILNLKNKDRINQLEKELKNKSEKNKYLTLLLNRQLGKPISSELNYSFIEKLFNKGKDKDKNKDNKDFKPHHRKSIDYKEINNANINNINNINSTNHSNNDVTYKKKTSRNKESQNFNSANTSTNDVNYANQMRTNINASKNSIKKSATKVAAKAASPFKRRKEFNLDLNFDLTEKKRHGNYISLSKRSSVKSNLNLHYLKPSNTAKDFKKNVNTNFNQSHNNINKNYDIKENCEDNLNTSPSLMNYLNTNSNFNTYSNYNHFTEGDNAKNINYQNLNRSTSNRSKLSISSQRISNNSLRRSKNNFVISNQSINNSKIEADKPNKLDKADKTKKSSHNNKSTEKKNNKLMFFIPETKNSEKKEILEMMRRESSKKREPSDKNLSFKFSENQIQNTFSQMVYNKSNKGASKTYDNCYSLVNLFYGSTSLLFYTDKMIEKFFNSPNIQYLINLYSDYAYFYDQIDENPDKLFALSKSLLNDFFSCVKLIYKLKLLIDHQNIFIDKMLLPDIIRKSELAVNDVLNCQKTYIFLVNYHLKEISCRDDERKITFPFDNVLFDHILKTKSNLNIKETRLDIRFGIDELIGKIHNFNPYNMLITPIFKESSIIAIIVSINKLAEDTMTTYFDTNDELVIKVFSKHLADNLLASLSYSEHISHDLKMSKMLSSMKNLHSSMDFSSLLKQAVYILKHLLLIDKAQIFVENKDNEGEFFKFDSYFGHIMIGFKGIIGEVLKTRKVVFCKKPFLHTSFNATLDLDSSLPTVTIPLINDDNQDILGILQFEYSTLPSPFETPIDESSPNFIGISRMDNEVIEWFCENIIVCINSINRKHRKTNSEYVL